MTTNSPPEQRHCPRCRLAIEVCEMLQPSCGERFHDHPPLTSNPVDAADIELLRHDYPWVADEIERLRTALRRIMIGKTGFGWTVDAQATAREALSGTPAHETSTERRYRAALEVISKQTNSTAEASTLATTARQALQDSPVKASGTSVHPAAAGKPVTGSTYTIPGPYAPENGRAE